MKNLILIFSCFVGLFISCDEPVSEADLEGTWCSVNSGYTFSFMQNTVYWSGKYDFVRSGLYEILDNNLQIITSKNDIVLFPITYFQTAIDSFSSDSLILDTMSFWGVANYYELGEEDLELIDFEITPFIISKEQKERFEYFPLKCFMEQDSFVMKVNKNYISYQDLSLYMSYGPQRKEPIVAIFLGKKVQLKDFSDLQYWLSLYRNNRITFFTQPKGFNSFSAFEMKLPIFEDMNIDDKWKPNEIYSPLPQPISIDKKEYLKYFKNAQKITVHSSTDLIKLNNIKKGYLAHILFNGNLDMKTYIQAQMILKPLFRTGNIRTEILGEVE
jgi:hypothetical protein